MQKITLFAFFFWAAAQSLFAQKDLPTESATIVKDFDARLLESNKINVPPSLPPLDTTTKRQDYLVPPKPLTINYDAPTLRPIGMKSSKKENDYNGYVKAGGGVPTSLYGELGYGFTASKKFDGKLWLQHHSANKKSYENQRFSKTSFLGSGNIYLDKNLAVEGRVGYSYDRVHFYGYDHDSLQYDPEQVRQDFKLFELGGRLYNSERTDLDLNFSVAPKLYILTDYYSNKETGFDLNISATKWFAEKHPLRVTIRTDFTSYVDTAKQNLNNIYLQPNFTFHADFLKLKVGGNFVSNRDEFQIFPDAELTLRLWGDGLQAFAGASGDLRKNNYRSISQYNPYIQMRGVDLRNTSVRQYYGGLKGNLGWLEYQGQVNYSKASDLALYQTRFDSIGLKGVTRFGVLYDTANIFGIQGSVKLTPIKNLVVSGTFNTNVYDLAVQEEHWGLPRLEINAGALYTLLDGKATVKAEVYSADAIPYRDQEGISRSSDALFDISFGGTYRFTDNIGIFLDFNNVLNNRRERWYTYPMYGVNILGGLTARF